jgi:hypothetical protein
MSKPIGAEAEHSAFHSDEVKMENAQAFGHMVSCENRKTWIDRLKQLH